MIDTNNCSHPQCSGEDWCIYQYDPDYDLPGVGISPEDEAAQASSQALEDETNKDLELSQALTRVDELIAERDELLNQLDEYRKAVLNKFRKTSS